MLPVPGILMLCNYLQNVVAITYIFVLQLSTFLFYNKHCRGLKPAIHLYKKFGFHEVPYRKEFWKSEKADIEMERDVL